MGQEEETTGTPTTGTQSWALQHLGILLGCQDKSKDETGIRKILMLILSKQATKEQEVLCDSNYVKICLCYKDSLIKMACETSKSYVGMEKLQMIFFPNVL